MRALYVRLMDCLYLVCMLIASLSIVAMTLIIAWSVFTRYVLEQGSFWAEPIAIFLAIQMTFYGGAACVRSGSHISIDYLTRRLPAGLGRHLDRLADVLMGAIALFMIVYGASLVATTFGQVYPEFELVRVGAVYTAIPIGGLIILLFVIEQLLVGRPHPAVYPGAD